MLRDLVQGFGVVVIAYFAVLNPLYIVFTGLAWRSITRYLRSLEYGAIEEALASPMTPPVSILLPAYNEEAGVVQSVAALLQLRYPEFEVIVINDGSKDGTLARLEEAFELVEAPRALRGTVAHAPVRATFRTSRHRELLVVDKENGGKADALNAGVDAARYPYVCAVDADAIIEPEALLRVAKPLLDDPDLVIATGGIVRIANGCRVENGRVTEVRLPSSRLATLQVVEYFRAFLVGRVGWSRLRALLIISGAFGLFRRETVEAVGGWWPDTVGEDMELVVRMHRHLRDQGKPYRVQFVPDPVCWTGARVAARALAPAAALAARAGGDALASSRPRAEPALRPARADRVPLLRRVRAARTAARARRLPRAAAGVGARPPVDRLPDLVPAGRRAARRVAVDLRAGARGVLVPPAPARARDRAPARLRGGREPRLSPAHRRLARRRLLGPGAAQALLGEMTRRGFQTAPTDQAVSERS